MIGSLQDINTLLLERGLLHKIGDQFVVDSRLLQETFEPSYGFESIAIKQKKNKCKSRLDADTHSEIIRGIVRPVPLIASNMSSVINSDFAILLYKLGAFGILHRAWRDLDKYSEEVRKVAAECEWVAASIGIGETQYELAQELIRNGANIICIDVAHGYSDEVINLAKRLKGYSKDVKVVAGNSNNVGFLEESSEWLDAVRVGIAQGFACETKNTAGCTEKQFSAVLKFKERSRELGVPVISDGGTREPADLVKAIAAGANSVMAGKIFAACPESAAEEILVDGEPRKKYYGMASRTAQVEWKGQLKPGTCPEGGDRYLPVGESAKNLIERYAGALKSGVTYGGGIDIKSFQEEVEFVLLK